MFREMRRSRQALSGAECADILERGTCGVLALCGDGGYPYAVPLSYYFDGRCIFFHCARQGHKLDALAGCDKVSFCVVDKNEIVPEKFTAYYRSVIVFGRAHSVEDEAEKRRGLELLATKYSPDEGEALHREVESTLPRVCILKLEPEHITGKEAIELAKRRG